MNQSFETRVEVCFFGFRIVKKKEKIDKGVQCQKDRLLLKRFHKIRARFIPWTVVVVTCLNTYFSVAAPDVIYSFSAGISAKDLTRMFSARSPSVAR